MVLDTSVLVTIALEEPEAAEWADRCRRAGVLIVGTPTLFEAAMVIESRMPGGAGSWISDFVTDYMVEVVPFHYDHWEAAFAAWLKYGKGRHPAKLNFGDCMSYAVAKLTRQPLLYVGDDFARTDIKRA